MDDERPYGQEEVLSLLRSRGMEFEEMHHPPVYTIDEMLALDMPDPEHIAKNLFLRDDKKRNYYLVVSREDRKVDLKALREVLGSRPLSMASENDLWEFLKLRKGAVTPFGGRTTWCRSSGTAAGRWSSGSSPERDYQDCPRWGSRFTCLTP